MDYSYIVVQCEERTRNVMAQLDGTVNKQSLRDAFHIGNDLSISLLRNGIALSSTEGSFRLGPNWKKAIFSLNYQKF
ncbi:unnamed protein product [Bursaphelenchus okinawaensis]|uniref:Uncharacterized protein n=1 Tax=Bursaphelenchus okinawaensis TaxID=465554 RepID=A0A811L3T2_9BILA|nr:unnamed protein product [Bursaphelenchus okinawaensis]CAG9115560.1 unnamed protein product [Bursaphelenchus okinawaensis]